MKCDKLNNVPISFEWSALSGGISHFKCFLIISRGVGGWQEPFRALYPEGYERWSFLVDLHSCIRLVSYRRVFKKPQTEPHRFIISRWFKAGTTVIAPMKWEMGKCLPVAPTVLLFFLQIPDLLQIVIAKKFWCLFWSGCWIRYGWGSLQRDNKTCKDRYLDIHKLVPSSKLHPFGSTVTLRFCM